jgi:hypothetical protein
MRAEWGVKAANAGQRSLLFSCSAFVTPRCQNRKAHPVRQALRLQVAHALSNATPRLHFPLYFHVAFIVIVRRFWPLTDGCSLEELDKIINACSAAGVQVNLARASTATQLPSLNVHRIHLTVPIGRFLR